MTPEDNVMKLVWLDLETTGLDPENGVILEIGVVVTDLQLNELARKSWVLPHVRDDILTMMDDYVLRMHLKSGLLKEVWKDRNLTDPMHDKARRQIIENISIWIRQACKHTKVKHCYLAGSSVGSFDMAWLKKHAPGIVNTVSYRVGDVSAFKVFFPNMLSQPAGGPAHRALDDLDYSIDQLRQMRTMLNRESAQPATDPFADIV
jgi:oligoribonuclease